MHRSLKKFIDKLEPNKISTDRKMVLESLIGYIRDKNNNNKVARLNFICTHNSRRSQLAQAWAHVAAGYFGIKAECFSGGVEVTALHPNAAAALERSGFKISGGDGSNPVYMLDFDDNSDPVKLFSKLYDDPSNPSDGFCAVMTCADADENCPFIPGAEKRVPVRYDDPKIADGTRRERAVYDERSLQIANEMFYVFSNINQTYGN